MFVSAVLSQLLGRVSGLPSTDAYCDVSARELSGGIVSCYHVRTQLSMHVGSACLSRRRDAICMRLVLPRVMHVMCNVRCCYGCVCSNEQNAVKQEIKVATECLERSAQAGGTAQGGAASVRIQLVLCHGMSWHVMACHVM